MNVAHLVPCSPASHPAVLTGATRRLDARAVSGEESLVCLRDSAPSFAMRARTGRAAVPRNPVRVSASTSVFDASP